MLRGAPLESCGVGHSAAGTALGVSVLQSTREPRDISAAFMLLEIITKSVKLGTDHGVNNRVNARDE